MFSLPDTLHALYQAELRVRVRWLVAMLAVIVLRHVAPRLSTQAGLEVDVGAFLVMVALTTFHVRVVRAAWRRAVEESRR